MSLLTNLVAYWKFDEASGNASDSSGNGNTLTNNGTVPYVSAKINNGIGRAGTTGNKNLGSTASFIGSAMNGKAGPFTLSYWIKFNSLQTSPFYMDLQTLNKYRCLNYISGGNYKIYTVGLNNPDFQATMITSPSTGVWYHIVITVNSGTIKTYVNGSNITTNTAGTEGQAPEGNFFNFFGNFSNTLDATVDEAGMWNRVLTTQEISDLYNSGNAFSYPFSAPSSARPSLLLSLL